MIYRMNQVTHFLLESTLANEQELNDFMNKCLRIARDIEDEVEEETPYRACLDYVYEVKGDIWGSFSYIGTELPRFSRFLTQI